MVLIQSRKPTQPVPNRNRSSIFQHAVKRPASLARRSITREFDRCGHTRHRSFTHRWRKIRTNPQGSKPFSTSILADSTLRIF